MKFGLVLVLLLWFAAACKTHIAHSNNEALLEQSRENPAENAAFNLSATIVADINLHSASQLKEICAYLQAHQQELNSCNAPAAVLRVEEQCAQRAAAFDLALVPTKEAGENLALTGGEGRITVVEGKAIGYEPSLDAKGQASDKQFITSQQVTVGEVAEVKEGPQEKPVEGVVLDGIWDADPNKLDYKVSLGRTPATKILGVARSYLIIRNREGKIVRYINWPFADSENLNWLFSTNDEETLAKERSIAASNKGTKNEVSFSIDEARWQVFESWSRTYQYIYNPDNPIHRASLELIKIRRNLEREFPEIDLRKELKDIEEGKVVSFYNGPETDKQGIGTKGSNINYRLRRYAEAVADIKSYSRPISELQSKLIQRKEELIRIFHFRESDFLESEVNSLIETLKSEIEIARKRKAELWVLLNDDKRVEIRRQGLSYFVVQGESFDQSEKIRMCSQMRDGLIQIRELSSIIEHGKITKRYGDKFSELGGEKEDGLRSSSDVSTEGLRTLLADPQYYERGRIPRTPAAGLNVLDAYLRDPTKKPSIRDRLPIRRLRFFGLTDTPTETNNCLMKTAVDGNDIWNKIDQLNADAQFSQMVQQLMQH